MYDGQAAQNISSSHSFHADTTSGPQTTGTAIAMAAPISTQKICKLEHQGKRDQPVAPIMQPLKASEEASVFTFHTEDLKLITANSQNFFFQVPGDKVLYLFFKRIWCVSNNGIVFMKSEGITVKYIWIMFSNLYKTPKF